MVASFFGTERTPLSGGNSKITRSDTLDPQLFIEHKHRKKQSLFTLWKSTKALAKKENKIPVLTTTEDNTHGFLITIHSDDFLKFISVVTKKDENN